MKNSMHCPRNNIRRPTVWIERYWENDSWFWNLIPITFDALALCPLIHGHDIARGLKIHWHFQFEPNGRVPLSSTRWHNLDLVSIITIIESRVFGPWYRAYLSLMLNWNSHWNLPQIEKKTGFTHSDLHRDRDLGIHSKQEYLPRRK